MTKDCYAYMMGRMNERVQSMPQEDDDVFVKASPPAQSGYPPLATTVMGKCRIKKNRYFTIINNERGKWCQNCGSCGVIHRPAQEPVVLDNCKKDRAIIDLDGVIRAREHMHA